MNIAQTKAISLIDKHSLPFIIEFESDFLVARNSAMAECTKHIIHWNIFEVNDWYEVREEILKIDYNKYKQFQK